MPGKSTQAIHGRRDKSFRSANYPIYNSTAFAVEKSDDYYRYINNDPEVYIYTRDANPTMRNVEEKLAHLEGGEDAVLCSSGMSAITSTILTFVKSGDAIAAARRLYGGTYRFLRDIVPQFGIDVHFLDDDELLNLQEFAPTAKLVYFETPVNPTCECVLMAGVVEAAKSIGAVTAIDN
ncbi:MAG: PLP-dependent transferase, partial [Anaerolineae bacterium]|nr:PLP-dependent transferase [Anaerolineae bacterium]